jgi:cytoskeletal protein CcmA (bactofilin family)
MPETFVKPGTTAKLGTVEGDLSAGPNVTIRAESGRKVVVKGRAHFEGPATIDCDFECQSMRVEGRGFGPGGDFEINGDFSVQGSADIDASATVTGAVYAGTLDVGGHFASGPLSAKRLRVGGHLTAKGTLEAEEVDVGGHMSVLDEVTIANLRVGGHAKIGGGSISGEIRVRGHFTTTRKLSFGRLQVFGNMVLPAGSSGGSLSAMGRLEFEGDSSCKELQVTGSAKVKGNLIADKVEVKGTLDVSGAIHSSKLEIWGEAGVGGMIECGILGIGGRADAEGISASDRADIVGEARTRRGLKSRTVVIGKGSRVAGPIIGDSVEIGGELGSGSMWGLPWWRGTFGRPTIVEDVYGKDVRIGAQSKARRIFGETIIMEEGTMADEVVYTKEVNLPQGLSVAKQPVKTTKLPDPPF